MDTNCDCTCLAPLLGRLANGELEVHDVAHSLCVRCWNEDGGANYEFEDGSILHLGGVEIK